MVVYLVKGKVIRHMACEVMRKKTELKHKVRCSTYIPDTDVQVPSPDQAEFSQPERM